MAGTLARAMAFGRRSLARLDLRRPGHASLHAGGGAVRGGAARRIGHHGPPRGTVQFHHPGGIPAGLGARRRLLRTHRGPARPRAHAEPHGADLCRLHRFVLLRRRVVAPPHLPVPGGLGDRRRMGRRRVTPLRNLAAPMASLGRRRPPDGCERRHPAGGSGQLYPRRPTAALPLPGGGPPRAVGLLDSPSRARAPGMARRQATGPGTWQSWTCSAAPCGLSPCGSSSSAVSP